MTAAEKAGGNRHSLPVFTAAGRTWTIAQVLEIAPHLDVCSGTAANPAPLAADDAAIAAAVEAFRYRHDLISAEECLAYLAQRGLQYADLRNSVARRLGEPAPLPPDHAEIDFLLSDAFATAACALAVRIAATVEFAPNTPEFHWTVIDAHYQSQLQALLVTPARARVLAVDRLRWLKYSYWLAEFDHRDAAQEAVLCVRDDHQSLSSVALSGGFPCERRCQFASALPMVWLQALSSLRAGDATVPIHDGDRWLVLALENAVEANLDDAEIAAAVDAQLLAHRTQTLLAQHVCWILPLA